MICASIPHPKWPFKSKYCLQCLSNVGVLACINPNPSAKQIQRETPPLLKSQLRSHFLSREICHLSMLTVLRPATDLRVHFSRRPSAPTEPREMKASASISASLPRILVPESSISAFLPLWYSSQRCSSLTSQRRAS